MDFRFHDLRHTFASHLAMNGFSMKAIADLLGHTSLAMVMRYAHLSPGHLQEAVNSLPFGKSGKLLENFPRKRQGAGTREDPQPLVIPGAGGETRTRTGAKPGGF